LCQNCAKLIDNDPARYTVELLRQWKSQAESSAFHALKGVSDPAGLPRGAAVYIQGPNAINISGTNAVNIAPGGITIIGSVTSDGKNDQTVERKAPVEPRPKLWLTYAWKDNEDKDIDFIVQEIDRTNVEVKFDRRSLIPGQHLWDQIGASISKAESCDAWGIVLTENSLSSKPCLEELAYALDRALAAKGEGFPIFALLHKVSASALPPALKVRLCIPLQGDWLSGVLAAVKRRPLGFKPEGLSPLVVKEHRTTATAIAIEVRPRFEHVAPFMVAVDRDAAKANSISSIARGPAGRIPTTSIMFGVVTGESVLSDGTPVAFWQSDDGASPSHSYFLHCQSRPRRIWAGRPENLNVYNW